MTFEFAQGETRKRVVAESVDDARNKLNAWCANEGQSLDGWTLVEALTVTSEDKPETRDGDA